MRHVTHECDVPWTPTLDTWHGWVSAMCCCWSDIGRLPVKFTSWAVIPVPLYRAKTHTYSVIWDRTSSGVRPLPVLVAWRISKHHCCYPMWRSHRLVWVQHAYTGSRSEESWAQGMPASFLRWKHLVQVRIPTTGKIGQRAPYHLSRQHEKHPRLT